MYARLMEPAMGIVPEKLHYVYLHRRVSDDKVFYVGKGARNRAQSSSGRNVHWHRIVKKHGFYACIVKDNMFERCALTFERMIIAAFGIKNLANAVDGGGGTTGWRHSEATKKAISENVKKRTPTEKQLWALNTYGRSGPTEEARRKQSIAKMGVKKGPMDQSTKDKIREKRLGHKASEQARINMRDAHLGKFKGKENPNYDQTVRKFVNVDGSVFEGTRGEFIKEYGLKDGCVSSVISGRQKSVRGWKLS